MLTIGPIPEVDTLVAGLGGLWPSHEPVEPTDFGQMRHDSLMDPNKEEKSVDTDAQATHCASRYMLY